MKEVKKQEVSNLYIFLYNINTPTAHILCNKNAFAVVNDINFHCFTCTFLLFQPFILILDSLFFVDRTISNRSSARRDTTNLLLEVLLSAVVFGCNERLEWIGCFFSPCSSNRKYTTSVSQTI